MSKLIKFDNDAIKSLKNGIAILAKAVKKTLGPKGKNVIIKKKDSIFSTKDGLTVAKEIFLKDRFENIGVNLVKEAAINSSKVAGDGTTTSIVFAESIFNHFLKYSSLNQISLKKGMKIAYEMTINFLEKLSEPIKNDIDLASVAMIATNQDEVLSGLIVDAIKKVKDGKI